MKATKKVLFAVLLVLVLAAVPMTTALADDKTPISCSLALAVVVPGTDSLKGKNNVKNEGQVAAGVLDCDVDDLDGVVTTLHGSTVKVNEDGSFSGKLKGEYTFETASGVLTGKIEADVAGAMAVPGDPTTVYYEAIQGKWELKDKGGVKGKGIFAIEMSLIDMTRDGIPDTLGGIGSLTGSVSLGDDLETSGIGVPPGRQAARMSGPSPRLTFFLVFQGGSKRASLSNSGAAGCAGPPHCLAPSS